MDAILGNRPVLDNVMQTLAPVAIYVLGMAIYAIFIFMFQDIQLE